MAKLHASEAAQDVAAEAMRIEGARGQLASGLTERLYRDAPLMIIGEGTNEIQRLIICRNLLERYGERLGALTSRDDLPDEQRQLVLGVRQAVEKDVAPVIQDLDAARRDLEPLVARLAELGLFGALAVPEHGGLGLPLATTALIVEEVARGSATLGAWLGGQLATTLAITRHAPAQRPATGSCLPWSAASAATAPVIGPPSGRPPGGLGVGPDRLRAGGGGRGAGRAASSSNAALEERAHPLLPGGSGTGGSHGGPRLRHPRPARPGRGRRGAGRGPAGPRLGPARRRRAAAGGGEQRGHRGHRGGPGPGRLRGGPALLAAALHLRPADLPAPGDPG